MTSCGSAQLDPTSLNTMISFATGGLLGDVCLHLIPHSFMGEPTMQEVESGGVRLIVVDEKRNVIIGVRGTSSRQRWTKLVVHTWLESRSS